MLLGFFNGVIQWPSQYIKHRQLSDKCNPNGMYSYFITEYGQLRGSQLFNQWAKIGK